MGSSKIVSPLALRSAPQSQLEDFEGGYPGWFLAHTFRLYQVLKFPVVICTCSKRSLTQDLHMWVASPRQDQIHPVGEGGFPQGGQRGQPCGGHGDGDHGFRQDFVCLSSMP